MIEEELPSQLETSKQGIDPLMCYDVIKETVRTVLPYMEPNNFLYTQMHTFNCIVILCWTKWNPILKTGAMCVVTCANITVKNYCGRLLFSRRSRIYGKEKTTTTKKGNTSSTTKKFLHDFILLWFFLLVYVESCIRTTIHQSTEEETSPGFNWY